MSSTHSCERIKAHGPLVKTANTEKRIKIYIQVPVIYHPIANYNRKYDIFHRNIQWNIDFHWNLLWNSSENKYKHIQVPVLFWGNYDIFHWNIYFHWNLLWNSSERKTHIQVPVLFWGNYDMEYWLSLKFALEFQWNL